MVTMQLFAREQHVPISYAYSVDTNSIVIREAVNTWVAYLQSRPDSMQENSLWSETDRNDRYSFDAARIWIFQSKEFMNNYPPMILSAEVLEDEIVLIKTLFQGLDKAGNLLPLALYNVYAKKQNEEWHMEHALHTNTADWKTRTIGGITFVMSPKHVYSSALARKAVKFCDSLTALYDLTDIEGAKYFVTTSKDELMRILGFDFYVSPPVGLTYPEKDYIFSAFNTEFHSHELAHLVFRNYAKTHHFIIEGVATWCGGSLGQSLDTLIALTSKDYLRRTSELTFEKVLQSTQHESLAYYTFGALICKQVFNLHGGSGLKKFLNDCIVDTNGLPSVIARALSIQEHEIDSFIKTALLDAHSKGND